MSKVRTLVLAALPVAVAATNALATDYFWNLAGDGTWTVNANWSPAGQPNASTDNATISNPILASSPVTVNLSGARAVGTLNVNPSTGGDNTLSIQTAAVLDVFSAIHNGGVVRFDNTTSSGTYIRINNNVTFDGTGKISLTGPSSNAIITAAAAATGSVLTNGATHTIEGSGFVGQDNLVLFNQGTISANLPGRSLTVDSLTNATNRNLMSATNGGALVILGASYDNASSGVIAADGAGSVVEFREGANIIGGTVRGSNGGIARAAAVNNVYFDGVRFEGSIAALTACDFGVQNIVTNTGTITVDPTTSSATDIEVQNAGVTFTGGGKIILGGPGGGANPGINGVGLSTMNNAADHTIEGRGRVGQDTIGIVNAGLIRASDPSGVLVVDPLANGDALAATATNTGTLRAIAGCTLQLNGAWYDNTGGTIEADGASANVTMGESVRIQKGIVRGINGGAVQVLASTNVFFDNVTFFGSIKGQSNCDFGISGTITNNGTITIEPTTSSATDVEVQGGGAALAGAGTLTLTGAVNPGINGVAGTPTLTNGASHTINGHGRVGQNTIGIVNQGTIAATESGQSLVVDPDDGADVDAAGADLDNFGTLRANAGATLELLSGTYRNRGLIVADGANAVIFHRNGSVIKGGTLRGVNGGLQRTDSSSTITWDGVTLEGAASVSTNADLVLTNTFVNTGTLSVEPVTSSATDIALGSNLTFAGNGTVVLGGTTAVAGINSNTSGVYTLTNSATHTIIGKGRLGQHAIGIVNNGTIVATDATTPLTISPSDTGFINNATLRAQGAAGLILTGGQTHIASGGSVLIDSGSTLSITGATVVTLDPGSTLTQNGILTTSGSAFLVNKTNFSPGTAGVAGSVGMGGTFNNDAAGTLRIDLGGTTPGTQYDQIIGTGEAVLAGTLDLRLMNGFDPALYSPALVIIDDTNGAGVLGRFGQVLNVGTGSKRLAVVYRQPSVTTVGEVAVVAALPGDADVNGRVEFADLVALAQNYNAASPRSWQTGDFNGDGKVLFDDLVSLAQNYGAGTVPIVLDGFSADFAADWALAQSLVPEPTSVLALGAAALALCRRRP